MEGDDGAKNVFYCGKAAKNYSQLFFKFIKRNRIMQTIEPQKILNLLNEASGSKFVSRKWNIINEQIDTNYDVGNEIIYNREVINPKLSD